MKKPGWLSLFTLVFGVLAMGVAYSQTAEENSTEVEYAVKEFKPDEAKDLFENWGRDKMAVLSAVNVTGDWCFTKETVSPEEEKGRIKVTMRLEQGSDDKVRGFMQTFYYEDNEWKTGMRITVDGAMTKNMLSGDILDDAGKNLGRHKFVFQDNACQGILNTGETNIFEIDAVRCSAK